ncbi:hypothetical protein T265_13899, partial [Opisthorchis viverrini]
DLASSIAWASTDEVFSAADDHTIVCWSLSSKQTSKVISLPATVFPTDMDWSPRQRGKQGSKSVQTCDTFILGATDGRFYLLTRNGKTDKGVEAHQGAVLAVRWNQDGTSFATGLPIYSLAWGSNNSQIVFTLGRQLVLQSLQANAKPLAWKAHEGLVLKIDWNGANDQILSGAEDCRYRLWDTFGRLLYSSSPYNHPITSLAWAPDGQLFAVGSFNMMRLCDRHGWSYAVVKTQTGSLLNMRWSADGTQIAAAGGNGEIIVGQVTDRWIEWNGFEAAVVDERTVEVQNIRNGATEHLEFRDRVTKASLAYNQLIVVTSSQCYVYSTNNFNTPVITELRECSVTLIVQCLKYFVLVDGMNIYVYSYDGRLVCSPKQPNLRTDLVHATGFSLSNDTIAVKNGLDEKTIYLFETATAKPIGDGKPIVHSTDVLQIGLDQCGSPLHQRLAILDRNKDLYLMSVRVFGTNRKSTKLTTMASSFIWSQTSNILAAVVNDNISVWHYPNIAFVDSDLLALTTHEHDTQEEFGKQPELLSFYRDRITIRRINGSVSALTVSPYPDKLHQLIATNKWNEALSLCRNVKDKMLWACLAGFATCAKDLDMAEIAFAEIEEVDKVEYIRYIKGLPKKEMQTAEMLMLSGEYQDAEGVLLQAGLYFRAIMLHLNSYNWNRAIELAMKYKLALDIVLSMRQAYLQQANRTETLERYLSQPKQNLLSTNALKERIEKEYEREQAHRETGNTKPTSPQNRSRPTIVT